MNGATVNVLHKFLGGRAFSFLLGIYLGVELLGYIVIICVTVGGTV